jgi:hypothetical protein
MTRCLVIVSIVAVGAAIFASPTAATEPVKYPFTFPFSIDLYDICSFPITLDSTITATEIDYFDQSGNMIRWDWHAEQQDTFTANGKTLVGLPYHYHLKTLLDSNGNTTHQFGSGLFEKVPLPDGSLFIGAGRADFAAHPGAVIILSPDKGNPGNIAGFCAALAPERSGYNK